MIKAPQNIPYFYNRASPIQLNKLKETFKHFGIKSNPLLGETLLRLGHYIEENSFCLLPTDKFGKDLFRIYKYYDSLETPPI